MAIEDLQIRPLAHNEHVKALDLWGAVFPVGRPYFERYYASDPWYVEGDTLGAFTSSGKLVSTVHICRRPVVFDGAEKYVCGGIANVATDPAFRKLGLSGKLLELAISHMADCNMHYSLLGTGVPDHYARYGWEPLNHAQIEASILSSESSGAPLGSVDPLSQLGDIESIYAASPRILQLSRTPIYFTDWISEQWAKSSTSRFLLIPGRGYAAWDISTDDDDEPSAKIVEFRACGKDDEYELLTRTIAEAKKLATVVTLNALPQFCTLAELDSAAEWEKRPVHGMMIRNIGLTTPSYEEVKRNYENGAAVWWRTDAF